MRVLFMPKRDKALKGARSVTPKTMEKQSNTHRQEAKQQYAERQEEKYGRLAEYSLDPENQIEYQRRSNKWARLKDNEGETDDTGAVRGIGSRQESCEESSR